MITSHHAQDYETMATDGMSLVLCRSGIVPILIIHLPLPRIMQDVECFFDLIEHFTTSCILIRVVLLRQSIICFLNFTRGCGPSEA